MICIIWSPFIPYITSVYTECMLSGLVIQDVSLSLTLEYVAMYLSDYELLFYSSSIATYLADHGLFNALLFL